MNLNIKELNELIYSLGITASKGMMCDKDLNVSLLNKLYDELNNKIAEEAIDEEVEYNSHYVNNQITDGGTEYKVVNERGWITQAILDYVDNAGVSTYKEMNDFYQFITKGSNSFSHHLYNLITPYKNRPTLRYLVKRNDGKYIVKVANESNWVVKEY